MGAYRKIIGKTDKTHPPPNYEEKEVDEKQKNKHRIRYRRFTRT